MSYITREDYAMFALMGILANPVRHPPREGQTQIWQETVAREAFDIADAMIFQARVRDGEGSA